MECSVLISFGANTKDAAELLMHNFHICWVTNFRMLLIDDL